MFNRIIASNFKSIEKLDIDLKEINVVIGANASGKSNFVDIFEFLKLVVKNGLEEAVVKFGGMKNLINYNSSSRSFSIELSITPLEEEGNHPFFKRMLPNNYLIIHVNYKFVLTYRKGKIPDFRIDSEELVYRIQSQENEGDLRIKRDNKNLLSIHFPKLIKLREKQETEDINKFFGEFFRVAKPHKLLIEGSGAIDILPLIDDFKRIGVYDIYPKYAKENTKIGRESKLKKDGSNMADTILRIRESYDDRMLLQTKIRNLLPFIKSLSVKAGEENDIRFYVKENYFGRKEMPSQLISYGSINIFALIIALYFENNKITVIEEPERNLHPLLILSICELFKEVSKFNQIIITTHNIEMIKNLADFNILIVRREEDGNSIIKSEKDIKEIKEFLKNDLGIEDLFFQNFPGI
ncbi:MAG: AAA family ATPase [Candidatus Nitrosocosmicus sp.]|nr:AAA family ATPase [Candidatus Nitrosocosmicus sp.]MDN5868959.1 AAA family ATPase [Candidatus Nitrosocosmicus sp.]